MATATPRTTKQTQMVEQVVEVIDGVTLELSKNEAEYIFLILGEFNGTISEDLNLGYKQIQISLWPCIKASVAQESIMQLLQRFVTLLKTSLYNENKVEVNG